MDKQQLQRDQYTKVNAEFGAQGALVQFLCSTLENFAYRYIVTEASGDTLVADVSQEKITVQALEKSILTALKVENSSAKQALIAFAKTSGRDPLASVQYQIDCSILECEKNNIELVVEAIINWNYPGHKSYRDKQITKSKKVMAADFIELRRSYPLALEDVCGLFI